MCVLNIYDLHLNNDRLPKLVKVREVDVGSDVITEPHCIYDILTKAFEADTKAEEYLYLVCCDGSGRVTGLFEVSHGGVGNTLTNVQGILTRILLCNSHHIFTAHNHPSGDCKWLNEEDIASYCIVRDSCWMLDVKVEDNVIIGRDKYMSFKEKGLLEIEVSTYEA